MSYVSRTWSITLSVVGSQYHRSGTGEPVYREIRTRSFAQYFTGRRDVGGIVAHQPGQQTERLVELGDVGAVPVTVLKSHATCNSIPHKGCAPQSTYCTAARCGGCVLLDRGRDPAASLADGLDPFEAQVDEIFHLGDLGLESLEVVHHAQD